MRDGIHQKQDSEYPRRTNRKKVPDEEERLKDENDTKDPKPRDVTEDESISEIEEFAGSEEGIHIRDDGLNLEKDAPEDREDNAEGRLPDIPSSAIKQ